MSATIDEEKVLEVAIQAVELARRAGASDAEAWVSTGRSASVRVREGEVDERIDTETGTLTLRVFTGSRMATATASDLAPESLGRLATDAVELAKLSDADPNAGLPEEPPDPVGDGGLDLVDPALVEPDPRLLLDLARRADAAASGFDPRVRSGEGATAARSAEVTALANSRGLAASYPSTTCSLYVAAAGEDDAGKKCEGWWLAGDRHLATMDDAEAVGRMAAERTRRQLGARPVPTRELPVVWSSEVAWSLVSVLAEAAGGDARYRGATFLIDREGDRIGSPLVTITDDATLPGRLGSRPFDVEGVASQRTPLFAGGAFTGFLYDTYSARKSGTRSTGNAGRSRFPGAGARLRVEPSNLVMAAGETAPAAIIGGVEQGLYLTNTLGFGVNMATGDFSRGAAGLWIEGGELAYPVSEVNIAGNLLEMLAGINAVGNDLAYFEAIAAPTFRIDRMMVSGR